MTATVNEAQEKWCPFARVPSSGGSVSNRACDGDTDGKAFCLSYACMSWRWIGPPVSSDARRGFCGLAGVPDA
jgi:hypothetical protein